MTDPRPAFVVHTSRDGLWHLRPVRQSMVRPTTFGACLWVLLAAVQVAGFAVLCWWFQS